MQSYNERFQDLCKKHGFKIKKVSEWVNGKWTPRPDVYSVQYQNHHIMSVARKLYGEPGLRENTLMKREQPMYFEREHKLKNWSIIVRRTPHIKGLNLKKLYA